MKKNKRLVNIIINIIIVALVGVLIYLGSLAYDYVSDRYKADKDFKEIESFIDDDIKDFLTFEYKMEKDEGKNIDTDKKKPKPIKKQTAKEAFDNFRRINDDIVAFISMDEVNIHLPVAWSKYDGFYLRRGLDKQYSIPGVVFIDTPNDKHLNDNNTIIYGHNMSNGVGFAPMFKDLLKYSDSNFVNRPDVKGQFKILQEDKVLTYQIFTTYFTDMYSDYIRTGYEGEEWVERLYELKGRSRIDFGYDKPFDEKDKIVTLSTCDNVTQSGRFTAQAILIRVDEFID